MVNWQITTTTVYCDAVDDEVTLMVYRDGSAKCTGYKKYHQSSREISKLVERKGKQFNRKLKCEGSECYRVIEYKEKLFAEEVKSE